MKSPRTEVKAAILCAVGVMKNSPRKAVKTAILCALGVVFFLAGSELDASQLRRGLAASSLLAFNNDVVYLDEAALDNIKATYEGAHAHLEWSPKSLSSINLAENDLLKRFQALPLLATVDRRPLIVRKQMRKDEKGAQLSQNGKLLGCALSATTFVSNLEEQRLKHGHDMKATCDVCFQFSNREDMHNFVPGVGYEPLQHGQQSVATKCFWGKTSVTARFADWQKHDERFRGFGYPYTVDCVLQNGIKELTCREISALQKNIEERDDVQSIDFRTTFELDSWFGISKQFFVKTKWPWRAVMSHDDDRSKIAANLSNAWDDVNSAFVPKNAEELKLAHVEGPGYDKTDYQEAVSLRSMTESAESTGGLHPRLVANLFHLMRNAPGSTHIMAVVDGQLNRTYSRLLDLLATKISALYPTYGEIVFDSMSDMRKMDLIPIDKMGNGANGLPVDDMTLMELLRLRGMKIHVVPITTPSLAFEKSVCGGQYSFTPYLAARFAADYQVMMFIDGDTAIVEGGTQALQSILYDRFFSKNSTKCAGHRLRLVEQFVKPENDSSERVVQCAHDLASNPKKWEFAMKNCQLKEGHIVARTDSIYAFSVHHPDTIDGYLPAGVENCITHTGQVNDRYFLKASELVQLHLRNRERKPECACFENAPK